MIRGQSAVVALGGRILEISTGSEVVDISADTPQLALAAALAMTPLNPFSPGSTTAPGAPLPPARPPDGFERTAS